MNILKIIKNLFGKKQEHLKFGLIPQTIDKRDKKITGLSLTIKETVDLRNKFPEVTNQSIYNSCTAHAVCSMFDYFLEYKKKNSWEDFDSSKAFLWYWSRFKEGKENKNSGVVLRNVFKAIKDYGFVPQEEWDYSAGYTTKPSNRVIIGGQIYSLQLKQLPSYYSVYKNEIKRLLSEEYPVVFGFPIYENFSNIGNNIYSELGKTFEAYHAMLIVGYTQEYYIIRNSWGKNKGDNGYYYIKCSLLEEKAFDMWTLKD
jgi:C1A family cysteine protease